MNIPPESGFKHKGSEGRVEAGIVGGTRQVIETSDLVGLGCAWRVLSGLLGKVHDFGAQRQVRREHAVVAMPMHSWRRHQGGNPVDQSASSQPRRTNQRSTRI